VTPTAVVFVPAAPLLVPQVAGGSAAVDADLRVACLDAVSRALDSDPDTVVVVASTSDPSTWDEDASWDFAGFGVPREPTADRTRLPWPLGIGAWLLDEGGWPGHRKYVGVANSDERDTVCDSRQPDTDSERCVVIVVADGSACRTERAPGHLDPRAEGFDDGIADALSRGDLDALAAIEPTFARQLLCRGVPAWRWLRAALGDVPAGRAELLTHVAPYGVAYFVALWWF
jgi:hypothetical protein